MNPVQGVGLSLFELLLGVINLYIWIVLIRALVSWVSPDPRNPIVRLLVSLTEPVLRPLRRLLPPHKLGGLDLSPMIVILLLVFLRNGLSYSFGLAPRGLF
jgi:YggT family protein